MKFEREKLLNHPIARVKNDSGDRAMECATYLMSTAPIWQSHLAMRAVNPEFGNNYGLDIALTMQLYCFLMAGLSAVDLNTPRSRQITAITVGSLGILSELSQYHDNIGLLAGTYDPKDMVAFAASAATIYAADTLLRKSQLI